MRKKIGPLEAIDFDGGGLLPAVVLFHGYGADAADLAPLAKEIDSGRPLRWLFPDAPLTMDFGGRAWFPIDVEAIEEAQRTGVAADFSQTEPEGFEEAARAAGEFIAALGVPWGRLILGGFSQGAMLATDLALSSPQAPKGLVILSGNLVKEKTWRQWAPKRAGLPFFQSHGIADPILGYQGAKKLERLLAEAGLAGKLLSFEGGHGIPGEVIEALGRFLRAPAFNR